MRSVTVSILAMTGNAGPPAAGSYLQTARMLVDRTPGGMRATTEHAAEMDGSFSEDGESWTMRVPTDVTERGLSWEIEDLLSLVLTTGWKRAAWVPLHAAGVTDGRRGAIVCAASGGGKTTFMMAMVRAGWRALGDDKLLLRSDGGGPTTGALKHMLNVDPSVASWWPEIGDLRGLPEYSAFTPKRRVALTALWSNSTATAMRPTSIISLQRRSEARGIGLERMDGATTLATLLRQTVIPTQPDEARWITGELAACAQAAVGFKITVGDDAYVDPDALKNVVAGLT